MRKTHAAALAGLALTAAVAVPAAASAAPAAPAASAARADHDGNRHCAAAMHAAVVEDNEAYAAKDAARYRAILNPDMISVVDGVATYGREANMVAARSAFATPGWHWLWTIQSETLFSCDAGAAVLDATVVRDDGSGLHANATMTMVRERGRWTVAMDTVHVISRTPPTGG
jgi:Domain of unknown function (DUF4440)